MATQPPSIASILERMGKPDNDFRIMAVSDLSALLTAEGSAHSFDARVEADVVKATLKLVEDASHEVQAEVGPALGLLALVVRQPALTKILDAALVSLTSAKPRVVDTAALVCRAALDNLVAAAAAPSDDDGRPAQLAERAQYVSAYLLPKLLKLAGTGATDDHVLRVLELLRILTSAPLFADLVLDSHADIVPVLTALFLYKRATVRKLAIGAYVGVAMFAQAQAEDELVGSLVGGVTSWLASAAAAWTQASSDAASNAALRTYVLALTDLVSAVPAAVTASADDVLATLTSVLADPTDRDNATDSVVELSEAVLLALEQLVLCAAAALPAAAVEAVAATALGAVAYDPNFSGSSVGVLEEEPAEEVAGGDGGGDSDDDSDGSGLFDSEFDDSDEGFTDDDEDISWKVRRAAWHVLGAVIKTTPAALAWMYETALPMLVSRFGEREPTVQVHVFATFSVLLDQTSAVGDVAHAQVATLCDAAPSIVRSLLAVGSSKAETARVGAVTVLAALAKAAGVAAVVEPNGASLERMLVAALGVSRKYTDDLRTAAAELVSVLALPPGAYVAPLAALLAANAEPRTLIAGARAVSTLAAHAEASTTMGVLVAPLAALLNSPALYTEVKKAAIDASAELAVALAVTATGADAVAPLVAPVVAKMESDVTRAAAVAAMARMAAAPVPLPAIANLLPTLLMHLTSFLGMAARPLRVAALSTVRAVVSAHASMLGSASAPAEAQTVVSELLERIAELLSAADLPLSAAAITTSFALAPLVGPTAFASALASRVLATAMAPAAGASDAFGTAVLAFYETVVASGGLDAGAVEGELRSVVGGDGALERLPTSAFAIAGRIVGRLDRCGAAADEAAARHMAVLAEYAVAVETAGEERGRLEAQRAKLVATIDSSEQSSASASSTAKAEAELVATLGELDAVCEGEPGQIGQTLFAAYAVSELAVGFDLSQVAAFSCVTLLTLLGSLHDAVRTAAAFALGSALAGSPAALLPRVLDMLATASPASVYSIVRALDHMLTSSGGSASALGGMDDAVGSLFDLLFAAACGLEGEGGTRELIGVVVGRLAQQAPATHAPLLAKLDGTAPEVVTALKALTTCVAPPAVSGVDVDAMVASFVAPALRALGDTHVEVRSAAIATLSFVATHYPRVLADPASGLTAALPLLYAEVSPRPELLESVDRGPFKQTIDHGAPNRAAALAAMAKLLTKVPDKIAIGDFITTVVTLGLADADHSVKLAAHRTLVLLAQHLPIPLAAAVDPLITSMRAALAQRPKAQAVQHELQLTSDLTTSTLRAVAAVTAAISSPKWAAFVAAEVESGIHADAYAEAVRESA